MRREGSMLDSEVVDALNAIFSDDNDWSMAEWGKILIGIPVKDINAEIYNLLLNKFGGTKRDRAKVEAAVNVWREKKSSKKKR